MIYRFDRFELDTGKRELRASSTPRALQPQAFAVLAYLVEHRDRAVGKRELLENLWPDAVVGEGSLQRAVSLARAAIEDDGDRIRTIPKHGYRFVLEVEEVREGEPQKAPAAPLLPRFAHSGDVHIAYHTVGDGPLDIVLVAGWAFPFRALFDHPQARRTVEELARLGRVILFDKRGTGLSDRVKELPSLEQRMDDLRAVLDAVASRQALMVGFSEGGPLCLLFATSYPERTRGLLLVGSFARWAACPGYEHGWTEEVVQRLRHYIRSSWGQGETIRAIAESRRDDPEITAWAARAEQEGASPGAALELLEMNLRIDVRPILPLVSVPTAILHHTHDSVIDVACSRDLAARIPGARLIEVDGRDHAFWFQDRERLSEALGWLAGLERHATASRFLSTILVARSDAPPTDAIAEIVARHAGIAAGPPLTFAFEGPGRAVLCGHALLAEWAERGHEAGIGVHAGEVGREGAGLQGEAVDTASAIAAAAAPGQVLVSSVLRELVHGSPLRFGAAGAVSCGGRSIGTQVSLPPDG